MKEVSDEGTGVQVIERDGRRGRRREARQRSAIACGVVVLLTAGCASAPFVEHAPVAIGTQDETTGIELRYGEPAVNYYHLAGHELQINQAPPIRLEPVGRVRVYLPPGRHEILCKSLTAVKAPADAGSEPREESRFGYTSRTEIVLQPHEIKRLRYLPPLLSARSGRIKDDR